MPDPTVSAAWIQGGCAVVASGFAASDASLIGKRFSDRKKIEDRLKVARQDILFMLEVEKKHCNIHSDSTNTSLKNTVRDEVRESGFTWSGKLVPSSRWHEDEI